MAIVSLNNTGATYDDGLDSIVVTDVHQSIRGGRTLDTTGYTPTLIRAGHVIIKSTTADIYRPMPVTGANSIGSLGIINGGSGYTPSSNTAPVTYNAVALTGGSGAGATANITVSGGMVTAVVLVAKGTGYAAGNVLSAAAADVGTTGTGFSVTVASVNEAGAYGALTAGYQYAGILISTVLTAKPFAGIMVRGNFNPVAAPYDFATIATAFSAIGATAGRITAIAD